MENANSHPIKVELVESADFHANSHPYKVEIDGGGDIATKEYVDQRIQGIAKIVDELPEEGEAGVTYFVLKEESEEGNIYDEYMYLTKADDSKVWEHIGATDSVDAVFATGEAVSSLKIYSGLGSNTDGLVLQKYVPYRTGGKYNSGSNDVQVGLIDYTGTFVASPAALDINFEGGIVRKSGATSNSVTFSGAPFTGATSSADGVQGMVPKPLAGDEDKVLKGDGTWTINYKTLNGAGAPTISTVGDYIGQLYYETTNDKMYYLSAITSGNPDTYTWEALDKSPAVVQTTGTSTTDVMSQDAATKMIFPALGTYNCIRIGTTYAANSGSVGIGNDLGGNLQVDGDGIAIGKAPRAWGSSAIAIGTGARTRYNHQIAIGSSAEITTSAFGAIALGAGAMASRQGELNIGCSSSAFRTTGYNNTAYRVIGGVHDGVDDHDVVTVGQMNTAIASAGATVITDTQFNTLWENA